MNLDYQAALSLFRAGRFGDIVRSALDARHHPAPPTDVGYRLLLAECLVYSERSDEAEALVSTIEPAKASSWVRARQEFVLGQIEKRQCRFDRALRHTQAAIRAAQEAKDAWFIAQSQIYFFRMFAEGYPGQEAAALLAPTRKLVVAAADPHLVAWLHDSVAIMEGQTGSRDEARRHLEIATSILQRYPNPWIEMSVHVNRFCVAWLESDFEKAAKHLSDAREACEAAIGPASSPNLEVNQAHLDLMTGRFPRALKAFTRALNGTRTNPRLAAADGLARLYLALNDLPACEQLVNRSVRAHSESAPYRYYPVRWAIAGAVRLAIRRGEPAQAITRADQEIESARALRDVPLTVALLLLRAEAEAACNLYNAAAKTLFEASELGATSIREQDGQFYHTCGRVLSEAGSEIGAGLCARAIRQWKREGNIWAQVAAIPGNEKLPLENFTQRELEHLRPTAAQESPVISPEVRRAQILNSVVAACDLSYDPLLAGAELKTLAAALGCGERVTCESRSGKPPASALAYTVRLRSELGGGVEIRCTPSENPLENIVLSNLLGLARIIEELAQSRRATKARAALWPESETDEDSSLFVSDEMLNLRVTARKIAPSGVPVLVTGETGTGKEIIARAIHAASRRAHATFLPFNCSVGPRDMIDAQLFGHRRGAFTGATEHAPGVIRAAAGGTLFLDEIGESPLEIQPKLLRFLESGEIHPIGESHPLKVDVRVIAATNVDLDAAVSSGRFREDLFYRLNIVRLHLPPLRERRVEIPVFAQHYLQKHAREQGKGDLRLAEETMEYLLLYKWPGNVRQLANEMRRLAALAETDAVLMPEHLSHDIVASRRTVPASERMLDANEVVVRLDQPIPAATEHLERAMLQYALKQCGGRMEETARALGLSRKGLYLKRLRFGLDAPDADVRTA